jgi:phage terminase large subunit-like protein
MFKEEMFQAYHEKDHDLNHDERIINFLLSDPARTTGENSADSSILGVAVDVYSNAVYVRDVIADKLHPDQFFDELSKMAVRLNALAVGVEVTGLHEFITYPLANELKRRNLNLQIVKMHARGGRQAKGKEERAKALLPFYRQGMIYHNKTATQALETQLKAYPRPAKWDIIDALAYLPRMLDEGELFMHPPGEGLIDSKEEVEREYKEVMRNTERSVDMPQIV